METPEDVRADVINRLRGAAYDATNNMSKFSDRRNDTMAQYYAGMRDGLLRAVEIVHHIDNTAPVRDQHGEILYEQDMRP